MNEETYEKIYSDMQQENADIRRREELMERLQIRDLDDAIDQLSTALDDCERLRRLWRDTQRKVEDYSKATSEVIHALSLQAKVCRSLEMNGTAAVIESQVRHLESVRKEVKS